jgi:hypothetical protein
MAMKRSHPTNESSDMDYVKDIDLRPDTPIRPLKRHYFEGIVDLRSNTKNISRMLQ